MNEWYSFLTAAFAAVLGIWGGVRFLWNARRNQTRMDSQKRALRALLGLVMLYIGVAYAVVAVPLPIDDQFLAMVYIRPALVILLAAISGYAIVEA